MEGGWLMAFSIDNQTGQITFGVVSDGTNDAIARDLASEFGVSETFKDTFNADNWVDAGTAINVNTGSEVIDWNVNDTSINHATSLDLGVGIVSDVQWVLRAKLTVNNVVAGASADTNRLYFGIFDSDQSIDSNTIQDGLFIGFLRGSTANQIGLFHRDGVILDGVADVAFTTPITATTFFIEIKRTSSTAVTMSLFSDAKYTTLIETQSAVIPTTIQSLRFIKAQNRSTLTGNSTLDGTIDNVQFWNTTSVPRITSLDWRMRFKLNLTNLNDGGNTIDKRLWMTISDEDETVGADSVQDSINLFIAFDQNTNRFILRDTNGQVPNTVGNDALFTAGLVTVSTKFVEIKRTSSTAYEASLFSDSTFTTLIESQSGIVSASTTDLRFIKFMNGGTLVNGAGAIDGTIDDFVYSDFEQLIIMPIKTFIVDAVLEGCTSDFCEDFNEYARTKLPSFRDRLREDKWVDTGTGFGVNPTTEVIDWDAINNNTVKGTEIDLGTPLSDDSFVWRFKVIIANRGAISGVSSQLFMLLSDTSGVNNSTPTQDFIGLRFVTSNILALIEPSFGNGVIITDTPTAFVLTHALTTETLFVEVKRTSGSLLTISLFNDSNFSDIVEIFPVTIPTEIRGLRHIKFLAFDGTGGTNVLDGTIENIEIWNEGQQGDITFQDNFLQKPVTFSDDFTTDQWVDTGAGFGVNTGTEVLNGVLQLDGADNHTSFDLGVISDESWVLRFRVKILSLSASGSTGFMFAISDTEAGGSGSVTTADHVSGGFDLFNSIPLAYGLGNSTGDGVTLPIQAFPATKQIVTISTDGSTDYFVELKRLSTTEASMQVFTDATFTTPLAGISQRTIVSTIQNLRYIKFFDRELSTTGSMTFEVDDVEFYNGTSTLTDWVGGGVDVVLGTTDKRINFDIPQGVQRDELIAFDLQTILDGANADDKNWTLRFKMDTDAINQGTSEQSASLFIGIDDGLLPANTSGHDFIGLRLSFDQGGAGPQFGLVTGLREVENGAYFAGGTSANFPFQWTTGTRFIEIKRLSPILAEMTLFTDSTYRTPEKDPTGAPLTVQVIPTSTLVNLRYIRISTDSSAVANDTTWDGSIDDIEFYNGVSVPKTPIGEVKDHEDFFIADNYTTMAGTKVSVNTTTQVIDWSSSVNAIYNEGEFNDIIGKPISTDRWTLRCKLVINTVIVNTDTTANDLYIGFSDDNTSVPNGFQDFIGWRYSLNNPVGAIRTLTAVAGQIDRSPEGGGTIYSTPVTTGTFYLETKRNGSNVTGTIFSDPDFTQVIEEVTEPIEVAITGLRFLKVMVGNRDGTGNHTYDGIIDNIQFWDDRVAKNHENKWRKIDL